MSELSDESGSADVVASYYKQHGYKTIVMGASFRNVRVRR